MLPLASSELYESAEQAVGILLAQYALYRSFEQELHRAENQLMVVAGQVAQAENLPISRVLRELERVPELALVAAYKNSMARRLQSVSDEMLFDTPLVWVLYKYRAYAGTPQELSTIGVFREHCSKPGYICTKRWYFLKEQLRVHSGVDVEDYQVFPAEAGLLTIYHHPALIAFMNDPNSMLAWARHEYYVENGRVVKWGDVA
jgi:hypothetical protein